MNPDERVVDKATEKALAGGLTLKSGAELGMIEGEDGRLINPHVPLFVAKIPWYSTTSLSLAKREVVEDAQAINSTLSIIGQATKYRKGACKNCGSMTHQKADCLERPRRRGAEFSGKQIGRDEKIVKKQLGFEAKRDSWNGYDSNEQLTRVKEWELVEDKRRKIRLESGILDEDRYAEEADQIGQKVDKKTRITVRNLRIREDTAKYLRNLDVDSAYYDPKTRSMRENPGDGSVYAGDNFERYTGQVKQVEALNEFAWKIESTGNKLHVNADPTQAELLFKEFKQIAKKEVDSSVLARYGGGEHLGKPEVRSEEYVEYTPQGARMGVKKIIMSRYKENELFGNHKKVWGSWWNQGWGYACCRSMTRAAYCGGQAAIEAVLAHEARLKQRPVVLRKDLEVKKGRKRRSEMDNDELEKYRVERHRKDDPMLAYLS